MVSVRAGHPVMLEAAVMEMEPENSTAVASEVLETEAADLAVMVLAVLAVASELVEAVSTVRDLAVLTAVRAKTCMRKWTSALTRRLSAVRR